MKFLINRGKVIQTFVATLGSISELLCGIFSSWTSPVVTMVLSEDTPLASGPMTQEQVSLMTSLLYLGAIVGCFLGGWLVNCIGRKWTLILSMIPQIIASICIIVAQSPFLLFLARTLCGILIGVALVVLPIFLSEIAEKNLKIALGNMFVICCNVGVFMGKSLTDVWGFYAVPVTCLIFSLIFIGFFVMLPDTPEYLIFRNRPEDAEKSLKFYRGVKLNDPLPEPYSLEFEELKTQVLLKNQSQEIKITTKDFREGTTILAIIVSFLLTCNLNFAGIRIVISFTETLLEDSGVPMDISLTDMIISLLQIFISVTTIFIVQWMGVRLSLLVFFFVSFVAFIGSGVHYFFFHNIGLDMLSLKWSFLIFITFAITIPGTVINNLTMSVPSQILPLKIKGSILGFLNIIGLLVAFLMSHYYLYFVEKFGNFYVMNSFGIWCLFGVIFTYFLIPEVKGKTFSEIIISLDRKIPQRYKSRK